MRFARITANLAVITVLLGLSAVILRPWTGSKASTPDQRPAKGQISGKGAADNARLKGAYRFDRNGWVYVHLEGSPERIGYQHGYLLAREIEDAFEAVKLVDTHSTKRDWGFFRKTAREMLWPKVEPEYQRELTGIAEGLQAQGAAMDLDDVIALNAMEELADYYVPWLDKRDKVAQAPRLVSPGNCSAFVATGSYTRGGGIVMGHNAWTNYMVGSRWRVIFDIAPERGYRMFMDGFPGIIISDDDFGVTSAGLMVTETTISQFEGFDPNGKPEFSRARKAFQYSNSIDDYVRTMLDGNNGGYANDWLLADRKTGEIAQFELGLKHHRVWRTKDGYFAGSNFASDEKVLAEETKFDPNNPESSPNARRARWKQLMKQWKGKIDVALGEKFLADHFDSFENKELPNERGLCGHGDLSARGEPIWEWGPYYPGGAIQAKVTDSRMTEALSFRARMGNPCGRNFLAAPFLKAHPEYSWMAPKLRDMKAGPWTLFQSNQKSGK